jgi:hypothetical protein
MELAMKQLYLSLTVLLSTLMAFMPAAVRADEGLDDLDATMTVLDDVSELGETIAEMDGPDDDDVEDVDWEYEYEEDVDHDRDDSEAEDESAEEFEDEFEDGFEGDVENEEDDFEDGDDVDDDAFDDEGPADDG